MTRDWIAWHQEYDEPESTLARRLRVVQANIRQAVELIAAHTATEATRVISLCAGEGRDLLPVLAETGRFAAVRARLVELDPRLAERAAQRARQLNLPNVEVVNGDAGRTTAYEGMVPAHVVLACGVFGNITAEDIRRTVATLRTLTAPQGFVVWTRGRKSEVDGSSEVRSWFAQEGFTERSFTAPSDARFRVGLNQLSEAGAQPFRSGVRMFSFVDD
jgi:hypothetical protein